MCDRLELDPTPESVAAARHWSVDHTRQAGLGELSDTVALLVSELVTNVVLHARTPCELSLCTNDQKLRIEVRDQSEVLPGSVVAHDPMASSGRGMRLIEALADNCGAEPLPEGGKVVWFQMTEPKAARQDA